MHLTFFALRALAREWNDRFAGARVEDIYSVQKDELSIGLLSEGGAHTLRISVLPGHRFVFDQDGGGRPRRNAVTLFEPVIGGRVTGVRIADLDRMVDVGIEGRGILRLVLFGPKANVLLSRDGSTIAEAFRARAAGSALPPPRAAPNPDSADALRKRWPAGAQPVALALARAVPLFDPLLASEAASRAGLAAADACLLDEAQFDRLFQSVEDLQDDLLAPRPCVYRDGRNPVALSLLPLADPPGPEVELFDTTAAAMRQFIRADLAQRAYRADRDPLERLLQTAVDQNRTRSDRMLNELSGPSRADRYERWGHLLMAAGQAARGREEAQVPDVYGSGEPVTIPLDPAQDAIENAQRFYAKARQTRRAREEAEERLESVDRVREEAERLLTALRTTSDRAGLKAFRREHGAALARFERADRQTRSDIPFRRFDLGNGYEVWVGRNAAQNDQLTFRHARKHDLWMHARGTAGSHVVLRRPRKDETPPSSVLDVAASVAAWFSKARGSELVPVIVTERKYVRKPRKAPAGAVLVEREEVRIVPPCLPDGESDE